MAGEYGASPIANTNGNISARARHLTTHSHPNITAKETEMGLAKIERENAAAGKGCLGKAADDEPVFILRAQDALAAELVELWAIRARSAGCPVDKVREAQDLADQMMRWPVRKNPD
jgi:hypothetical protein